VPFEGALQQAPASVLKANEYVPKPKHDLIMVVHVLFQVMCHGIYQEGIARSSNKRAIRQFWKQSLVPYTWKALHKAAKKTDYAGLKVLISKLLP